jgi:hypothetical protein
VTAFAVGDADLFRNAQKCVDLARGAVGLPRAGGIAPHIREALGGEQGPRRHQRLQEVLVDGQRILSPDAGEDSYNLLPLMRGEGGYDRDATVHHSCGGQFAIRKGPWKLLLHPGSGGNRYDGTMWNQYVTEPDADHKAADTPVQLYRRDNEDIAEKRNLYREHPEIVEELGRLLIDIIDRGRNTPGAIQPNADGENRWEQVEEAIRNLEAALRG